jgi:hypothetical protein
MASDYLRSLAHQPAHFFPTLAARGRESDDPCRHRRSIGDHPDHLGRCWSGRSSIIRPVHKSPSLTIAENWLATVVSTVAPTVSRTICFRRQPMEHADRSDPAVRTTASVRRATRRNTPKRRLKV